MRRGERHRPAPAAMEDLGLAALEAAAAAATRAACELLSEDSEDEAPEAPSGLGQRASSDAARTGDGDLAQSTFVTP